MLIPEKLHAFSAFKLESEYLPAQQVGGDLCPGEWWVGTKPRYVTVLVRKFPIRQRKRSAHLAFLVI
jgi:hypothetical protein